MHQFISFICVGLFFNSLLHAEEQKPIELILEGQAIESPVLKYKLLPAESELHDGNAVPILLRLPWEQNPWMMNVSPTLEEWSRRPLVAPEWDSFGTGAIFPERFYGEIKRAAYRREAHWEYPIQETQSPYGILLPDAQGLRVFLKYGLTARIRYHLSKGELDQAREGILIGHANARHLAQTPFYVLQLVSASIHHSMLDQTTELISQPNSPNLYWALSGLPESLLEMERSARLAGHLFEMTFPAVNDFDRPRTQEEWRKMADQLVEYLVESGELEIPKTGGEFALEVGIRSVVIKLARPDLTKRLGIPAEKVAAMSDEEVGLRWYTHLRMSLDQKAAAIHSLPPREAWPELRRLQDDVQDFSTMTGMKQWEQISPCSVYVTAWSLKRKIQSLRVIEAVRHHMATHDGQLPARLDDMQGVSIPLDPLTELPFEWQVDGQTATLKSPALPADIMEMMGSQSPASMIEYRVRVRSKK